MAAVGSQLGDRKAPKLVDLDGLVRKDRCKWPGRIEINGSHTMASAGELEEIRYPPSDDPFSVLRRSRPPIMKIQKVTRIDFKLPLLCVFDPLRKVPFWYFREALRARRQLSIDAKRSEEHTSELQSLAYLVCRLL